VAASAGTTVPSVELVVWITATSASTVNPQLVLDFEAAVENGRFGYIDLHRRNFSDFESS